MWQNDLSGSSRNSLLDYRAAIFNCVAFMQKYLAVILIYNPLKDTKIS